MNAPIEGLADVSSCFQRVAWTPPPRLTLSQWARKFYRLPAVSADSGRFRPYKFQVGIMDALTDPKNREVSFKKCARVGATMILNAWQGYTIHYDPCPMTVAQPTIDDAEKYSKEEVDPMISDIPEIAQIYAGDGRKHENTLRHKTFPGGVLQLIGANSGAGFRRTTRRRTGGDEVDAWTPAAGDDGDQVKLLKKRTETYRFNSLSYWASTPLVKGTSRIDKLHAAGDQRVFKVPCPHCGKRDELIFRPRKDKTGHVMRWHDRDPSTAHFVCSGCEGEIHEADKYEMLEAGDWVATQPFNGHASFFIWSAYSYSLTWADIVKEFLDATAAGVQELKTFVNTWLAETWAEQGDVPDWERLYQRREQYPIGTVPTGGKLLTCGVDVQKDRIVYEVVAWGDGYENWSVEADILWGGTATPDDTAFQQLDKLLARTFSGAAGQLSIQRMAIDSGNFTQTVYQWCKRYPKSRVYPVKGSKQLGAPLVSSPTKQEIRPSGRRVGSIMLWTVGVGTAKSEFYGWLNQRKRENGSYPTGFCHLPDYEERYFLEVTSEILVTKMDRHNRPVQAWIVQPGRENHFLDCRNYARHAAELCGVSKLRPRPEQLLEDEPTEDQDEPEEVTRIVEKPKRQPVKAPPAAAKKQRNLTNKSSWLRGGGGLGKRKGWIR